MIKEIMEDSMGNNIAEESLKLHYEKIEKLQKMMIDSSWDGLHQMKVYILDDDIHCQIRNYLGLLMSILLFADGKLLRYRVYLQFTPILSFTLKLHIYLIIHLLFVKLNNN